MTPNDDDRKPPRYDFAHKEEEITVDYEGGTISGPRSGIERFLYEIREQKALRARWPEDTREAMTVLCKKFPTLCDADGVEPWDVDRFIAWLNGPAPGHGAAVAGRFVLSVWNRSTDWTEVGLLPPGKFDLFEALGVWDKEHKSAFLEWVIAPFWP